MSGWIFETVYADVAVRLAAGYLWLWAGVLMLRLRLRGDFGNLVCGFCLLNYHGNKLVPAWFLGVLCREQCNLALQLSLRLPFEYTKNSFQVDAV